MLDNNKWINQEPLGPIHWGSFADFAPIHQASLNMLTLPEITDFAVAASLTYRFATSFRAMIDHGKVGSGQWVAFYRLGGVCLSAIMIAEAAGKNVIDIDLDPTKLVLAKELVAIAAFDGKLMSWK